jgi:hypothetical protein
VDDSTRACQGEGSIDAPGQDRRLGTHDTPQDQQCLGLLAEQSPNLITYASDAVVIARLPPKLIMTNHERGIPSTPMKAAAVVRAEVPVAGVIPRPKRGERAQLDLMND